MNRFLFFHIALFIITKSIAGSSILFVENKGQWVSEVKYVANIPEGQLFIMKDRLVYSIEHPMLKDAKSIISNHLHAVYDKRTAVFTVKFKGMKEGAMPEGRGQSVTKHNYYYGNDPKKHAEGCRVFESVVFRGLYEGIDLNLYAKEGNLKYDLIIDKQADPSQVKFSYTGDMNMYLEDGCSFLDIGKNTLMEDRPVAYQERTNCKIGYVDCTYQLNDRELSFELGDNYNPDEQLVIDPELIFSTFSGSVSDNFGFTACFDDDGNLYSGGIVFGSTFGAAFPAPKRNYGGGTYDIAIFKYNSSGSNLLYATFIGGNSGESPHSLIVNHAGELVIMGTTGSDDYPVTSDAYDKTYNGGTQFSIHQNYTRGTDLVVTKLDSEGRIMASTFVGSSGNDGILKMNRINDYINELIFNYGDHIRGDVIVDGDDNIYVASNADSTDFPVVRAIQDTYAGGDSDAVVFSLNTNLSTLRWSTYFGGNQEDAAHSIKLNRKGHVLIGGGTSSANFPSTSGVVLTSYQGEIDGFVSVLDMENTAVVSSTFLGTSDYDQVYFIDIDANQNVYATGQTSGAYPLTGGVYSNHDGAQFIHKLNPDLTSTSFSTVLGSGRRWRDSRIPDISPTAFLVSECENIFLSGWGGAVNNSNGGARLKFLNRFSSSGTSGMPVTTGALYPRTDGSDFYLMVLSADASELLYATFYGGSNNGGDHVDGGTSRFDKRGVVYQSVCSCGGSEDDFPTTTGAWFEVNRGVNSSGTPRCNNGALKFDLSLLDAKFETNKEDGSAPGIDRECSPFTVVFTNTSVGGKEVSWNFGDGTMSDVSNNVVHTYDTPETYTVTLTIRDRTTCKAESQVSKIIRVFSDPKISISGLSEICTGSGSSVQLASTGGISYRWKPEEGLDDPSSASPVASPLSTTIYKVLVTTSNGCSKQDSVEVKVIDNIKQVFEVIPKVISTDNSCAERGEISYEVKNGTVYTGNFTWDFGDGTSSHERDPVHTYQNPGTYNITLKLDGVQCVEEKSVELIHENIFIPNVFTPNDDGVNDFFEIRSPFEVSLTIMDRTGTQLFSSSNYQNNWDGGSLPSGIYYYYAEFPGVSGEACKGWLQLLR